MILSYANGTDSTTDVSYFLKDNENYQNDKSFFDFLYQNLTIENNIFGYIAENIIKLNSIPKDSFPIKCLNGIFIGKKEQDEVLAYKGIPFAKPPIKELRWKPPVPCDNSGDIFEAYSFQKNPIQIEDPGEVSSYYEIGEDCLYLNIWKYNNDIKKRAVMVFIHGGGFGWGGPTDPLFEGHNFVKTHHDIIMVTITYRVSILGFLDLTQIKGGENYKEAMNIGLLDQIQALKWINQNIEFFGGDKNNVTLVG